jgi:hypothetical protein
VEGWTVVIGPDLQPSDQDEFRQKALKALANQLQRVTYIVPADRVAELKKLPIWLDREHKLGGMQYHPDRGWLLAHGHDGRLVKHVHIPRAAELWSSHTYAKHPYAVLHELAHAYHDQVLSFEHPEILAAYKQAVADKRYENVLLYTGRRTKHYALTDHKEYFAELTEAYFGVNDFYPFVRAELREHDSTGFATLEKIWGRVQE